MKNASISELRSYLFFIKLKQSHVLLHLDLNKLENGYFLTFDGYQLMSSRRSVRVFKTLDAAASFVDRHFCQPLETNIHLIFTVAPGQTPD